MDLPSPRSTDDRVWEHRLFPFLLTAFAVAAAATLTSAPPRALSGRTLSTGGLASALFTPAVPPEPGLVPVQIADVISPDGTNHGVVLLIDSTSQFVLPVFLSASKSEVIRDSLKPDAPPASPDVLGHAVAALGGEIERIEMRSGAQQSLRSAIVLKSHGREMTIDADPGDALALAISTHAPLYAAGAVLDTSGIRRDSVAHLPGGLPSQLRDSQQL